MTTATPTITVVVPAYNGARTIGGALTSILTQDVAADVDVVVVDDGSTDGTAQIVDAYAAAGLPVTVVRQDNGGVSRARNTGIRAASGELVALIDCDDEMLPGYLATALSAFREADSERTWVTLNGYLLTPGGLDPRRKVMHLPKPADNAQVRAILEGNFAPSFTLFPKAMIDEIGGFDEALVGSEDWDLWARAIIIGWRVQVVREPLALYRWQPGSLSTSSTGMWDGEEAMLRGLRANLADRLSPADRDYLDARIEAGSIMRLGRTAEDALRAGDFDTATATYRTIARLTPSDRRSVLKARTLANPAGRAFWRRRLLAADRAIGRDKAQR